MTFTAPMLSAATWSLRLVGSSQRSSIALSDPGRPYAARVSRTRRGAPSVEASVNEPARIVPRWSATRSTLVCTLFTKHTRPSAPIGANATFGSNDPGEKFTFDATGGHRHVQNDTN